MNDDILKNNNLDEKVDEPDFMASDEVDETNSEIENQVSDASKEETTDNDSSEEDNKADVEFKAEETSPEDTKETPEETKEDPKEEEPKDEITSMEDTSGQILDKRHPNSDQGKWYIVHTYAGHENKVAKSLKQRVESMGHEDRIFDIIVPTRNTVKVNQGKKETVAEKIFPGYVIIKMILDDESWLLVRTTQGVTSFIGAGNKPTPISEKEVKAIQAFMKQEDPQFSTKFTIGEAVKITDGPFADFLGSIDAIDNERGKIKVLVSMFGRETPVELDFLQVQKI